MNTPVSPAPQRLSRVSPPWMVAMLWLLPVAQAAAHSSSQGTSTWRVDGPVVTAEVWLGTAELDDMVVMDRDGDGVVSAPEAADGDAALGLYMRQSLRVFAGAPGAPQPRCEPRYEGMDLSAATGTPLKYPVRMAFTCPGGTPVELTLGFGLFAGTPLRHVNVGWFVDAAGEGQQLLFTPERREIVVRAVPPTATEVLGNFWTLGVEHIVTGYDHLLFLLALLVAATRFRDVAIIVTSFTVAHSVTLGLAALDVIRLPGSVVEPLIAASIVWVAAEDGWVMVRGWRPRVPRAVLTFGFGLVHGFGFASVLAETPLPRGQVVLGLGAFNLGVESGQLVACALAWSVLGQVRKQAWGAHAQLGVAAACAVAGAWWLVSRVVG